MIYRRGTRRRGFAPIEFVFSLPLLLLMTAMILWLGFAGTQRAQLEVVVRQEAWSHRYEASHSEPWKMAVSNSGLIHASKSKRISFLTILDSKMPVLQSQHVVLAGSWDKEVLPLTHSPAWQEAQAILREGGYDKLTSLENEFNGEWGSLIKEGIVKLISSQWEKIPFISQVKQWLGMIGL